MCSEIRQPGLYGLTHSNREGQDLWGKNQFNSAFPASLACFMRDTGVRAVYLTLGPDLRVTTSEIEIGEVFNTDRPNDELRFEFESKFRPYLQYATHLIDGVDLVVRHNNDSADDSWRRALEVKLTVMPDNTTCQLSQDQWGPELVIRPASTKYCALGIYHETRSRSDETRSIFEEVCGNFELWNSSHELRSKRSLVLKALDVFQKNFLGSQKPFLLQPIWKTEGKSPSLSNQAFDIFVWSDFALCRTFIDKSLDGGGEINRYMRASARLARVLYELATKQRANLNSIYTEMAYRLQTDKEFALPGNSTRVYMNSVRRLNPALGKEVLAKIILNGGEKLLSPERRFDATVYFTTREIFEIAQAKLDTEGDFIKRSSGIGVK